MVVLNKEALGYINVFSTMTKSDVRQCFITSSGIIFVVETHQAGLAIGKNGINIRRLSQMFHKPIRVIEYNEDKSTFLKNILFPLIPKEVMIENEKLKIVAEDYAQKGKIYGRDRTNLARIKEIFASEFRNFEITIE